MTTYAPPAVRRTPSRAVLIGGLAAVTAVAVATGVAITDDPAPGSSSTAVESIQVDSAQRATKVAAVADQLEALRRLGAADPAIRAALAEDIATLEAALAGDIPIEAALPSAPSDSAGTSSSSVPSTVR